MKKMQNVTGIFAFWRYDQYPYVLGGEASQIDDNGLVYIESYQGWFKPIKVMPLKKGRELLDALKGNPHGLEHQRRDALDAFNKHWDELLFVLFPDASDPTNQRHVAMKADTKKKRRG